MGRGVRVPVPSCVVHLCTMFCPTIGLAEWQYNCAAYMPQFGANVDDMLRMRQIDNLIPMSHLMQVVKTDQICMLEGRDWKT